MAELVSTVIMTVAIKESLKVLIKSTIGAAFKGVTAISDAVVNSFSDRFSSYIERQLEKHSYLSTLVFQNPILLEDLYIPLTIQLAAGGSSSSDGFNVEINSFKKIFLKSISEFSLQIRLEWGNLR